MELISVELEHSLKEVIALSRREPLSTVNVYDTVGPDNMGALVGLGLLTRPGNGPVSLTPKGRSYFKDRRRDTRHRWAPVLASAAIGVFGTLLGVIATLLLTR